MLIGLHDAEYEHMPHKSFPNYALMKISAYHTSPLEIRSSGGVRLTTTNMTVFIPPKSLTLRKKIRFCRPKRR